LALGLVACGERAPSGDVPEIEDEVPTITLVKTDSIGIEMGDSNYVMGAIEGVAHGPDGNIAVLDCAMSCVKVFSPQGEYLRRIGRKGSGPGELQDVAFLAISEDGHLFMTGEGGGFLGLHVFDYRTGEWITSGTQGGSPPTCLEGAEDSMHVRKDLRVDMVDDQPMVLASVAKWNIDAEEPEVVYHQITFPYDPSKMALMVNFLWGGFDVAAGCDGSVFVAPRDTEKAVVFGYEPDGTERFSVDLGYEPVRRTPEEMEMERLVLRTKATIIDMDHVDLEPDEYKPLIRGLELDGEGNLWVLRGGPSNPTFDVLSAEDGTLQYRAVVDPPPTDGSTWRFCIDEHGILAYAEDPADGYQKVYVLEERS
jgi:hypothetical protein